tara:strand:- start:2 stop:481 length:480 start_codon:yes stop_codon:yes gene_type:complete
MKINKDNLGDFAIGVNLFNWVVENIPHNTTILELGSGTGTHELGKIYDTHCIEDNKEWINKFPNLTYHYAPIKEGWYDRTWLGNLPKNYSLLILDAPRGDIGRTKVLENLDLFNLEVPIIVDDTHREVEKNIAEQLISKLNTSFIEIKEYNKSAYILNV